MIYEAESRVNDAFDALGHLEYRVEAEDGLLRAWVVDDPSVLYAEPLGGDEYEVFQCEAPGCYDSRGTFRSSERCAEELADILASLDYT